MGIMFSGGLNRHVFISTLVLLFILDNYFYGTALDTNRKICARKFSS